MKAETCATFCVLLVLSGCSSDEDPASPANDAGTTQDSGGNGSGSNGGCDVNVAGKTYCVDYVGSGFEPAPALNATKNACTQSSGTWNDEGCSTDGDQGYCSWFEGTANEQRYYFYNYSTDDLAKEKTDCENNADRTWHDG